MSDIRIETLTGDQIEPVLAGLAALRIGVFRAFPYLYEGTTEYEARYLRKFAQAPRAVIVAAYDGKALIGAATAAPLEHEHAAFRAPLEARGFEVARIFYFAESVLDPAYRGRGIGHAFFDAREAHARSFGDYTHAMFCSVVRPADHPARPASYTPLDGFWRKRGYAPVEGLTVAFPWKDVGDSAETEKPMQVWMREL